MAFDWQQAAVRLGAAQGEADYHRYTAYGIDLPHTRLPRLAVDATAFCPADVRYLAVDTFERAYERRQHELHEDDEALDPFEDDLTVDGAA